MCGMVIPWCISCFLGPNYWFLGSFSGARVGFLSTRECYHQELCGSQGTFPGRKEKLLWGLTSGSISWVPWSEPTNLHFVLSSFDFLCLFVFSLGTMTIQSFGTILGAMKLNELGTTANDFELDEVRERGIVWTPCLITRSTVHTCTNTWHVVNEPGKLIHESNTSEFIRMILLNLIITPDTFIRQFP